MEEDVGLVLVFSSATDLPPAVAGVHQLLGMTVQEAEYPDTNPTSEEDKEQEGAEDIRAGPVLGDVVFWVVISHTFETLECYWMITLVTESMQTKG